MHYLSVTTCYKAKIREISLGLFLDSESFGGAIIGIEEDYKERKPYSGKIYKRFWLLNYCNGLNLTIKEAYQAAVDTLRTWGLDSIRTNNIHLASLVTNICRNTEIIETEPETTKTLIKSLLRDKKLAIMEHLLDDVNPLLQNYDVNGKNYFVDALYLAVNYELNSVYLSEDFPPLPTEDIQKKYEGMPFDELFKYVWQSPEGTYIDPQARAIYQKRWDEMQRLEMEELRKLPDFKY